MNILVVDDNTDARKLLSELLTQSGFNVFEAENGKQAIEILQQRKDFVLIISDILMSVMDGFKFCYEVKSNPELRHIPFIFFTGSYVSNEDRILGLKLGAADYIIKPIKPKLGKCIVFINDVSDLKKLQDEKRKIELKLWQKYRLASIGRLAGGIAHNLKIHLPC
ncbi:MAG: response regulator [Candidatus Kryptonium sp.]